MGENLDTHVLTLTGEINKLATAVAVIQERLLNQEKFSQKQSDNNKWLIGISSIAFLSLLGMAVTIALFLIPHLR